MDSFDFVANYHEYLKEISQVIRPEYNSVINELGEIDPHDLVRPDTFFLNESAIRGLVWSLFLKKVRKNQG